MYPTKSPYPRPQPAPAGGQDGQLLRAPRSWQPLPPPSSSSPLPPPLTAAGSPGPAPAMASRSIPILALNRTKTPSNGPTPPPPPPPPLTVSAYAPLGPVVEGFAPEAVGATGVRAPWPAPVVRRTRPGPATPRAALSGTSGRPSWSAAGPGSVESTGSTGQGGGSMRPPPSATAPPRPPPPPSAYAPAPGTPNGWVQPPVEGSYGGMAGGGPAPSVPLGPPYPAGPPAPFPSLPPAVLYPTASSGGSSGGSFFMPATSVGPDDCGPETCAVVEGEEMSETGCSDTTFPPFRRHDGTEQCACPTCLQVAHYVHLFSNQRQASRHVMLSRPSAAFAATGGLPPPPPPVPRSDLKRCPVFDAFGFCPYIDACCLPHVQTNGLSSSGRHMPLVAPAGSADEEVERLIAKSAHNREHALWDCEVCGCRGIDECSVSPVGAVFYHRVCPHCNLHCYFPYITYIVQDIVDSVGDDYQQYKTQVDHYRAQLPHEYRVPLTHEAHRVANIIFGWSLVSPADIKSAIDAAYRTVPDMVAVISMGSGAGYIEHVLNRVMNPGVPAVHPGSVSQRRVGPSKFPTTSFDGVRASFYGKRIIPIYAFDEAALSKTYSVHVSYGKPLTILSMHCERTVLFLSWPPFGSADEEQSSMSFETLEYFTQQGGQVLIYIGDVGATGDWRFHQLLYTHFKLVKDYAVRREVRRWSPPEMGFVYAGNDTIGVYERRSVPIPLPTYWNYGM